MAVNIATFADVRAFKQKVDELWEVMKLSPTPPGVDGVRLPGGALGAALPFSQDCGFGGSPISASFPS